MTYITLPSADRHPLLRRPWEFGFNTCHAPIAMRGDVQAQMRRANRELGHRYWRCHGTLSDDVGIVNGSGGKFCFSGLARIVDAGLQAGVTPFFELSFMPAALARDSQQTITHYRGITSPPKNFSDWERLVFRTVAFLADRHGVSALRKWYFEVWNEPNVPFWTGTQREYFELYRRAALAVKRVDGRLRVGGPATARGEWIGDFLRFARDNSAPVDFVSTHVYPSDVAFSELAAGRVKLKGLDYLRAHFQRVANETLTLSPKLPVFWGEWNSSAGPLAVNHDTCNNAALSAGALALMSEFADGSLFWNLSDIYEECQYHFAPFHGGYGLYTVDGVAKSAARAMELLRRLPPRKLALGDGGSGWAQGFLAADGDGRTSVLLWNHEEGRKAKDWKVQINFEARNLGKGRLTRILPGRGSAYEAWVKMGSPANLSDAQLKMLQRASVPQTRLLNKQGKTPLTVTVPSGSVAFVEFEG